MKKVLFSLVIGSLFNLPAFSQDLTCASYRLAKDFFTDYEPIFKKHWFSKKKQSLDIRFVFQSPAKNVKAIINGLKADIIAVTLSSDIDKLADSGFVDKEWRKKFPNNSSPYYTSVVFLVRKGNPKNIQDWQDLIKHKVSIIFPDPRTSSAARYAIIAALLGIKDKYPDEKSQDEFLRKLTYHLATYSDSGDEIIRQYVRLPIDVLITFEMEAHRIKNKYPEKEFEVITPPISVLAEFPVAVVDKIAEENGNLELAQEYFNHMYSKEIQKLLADKFNYRVVDNEIMQDNSEKFPNIQLRDSDELGKWSDLVKTYFAKGGKWDNFMNE